MTKPAKTPPPIRVGMISLGCAKNLVDAEIMLGSLLKGGVEITNDAASADAVIVNTCSFIDSAQEESVDSILESIELRDASQRGQGSFAGKRKASGVELPEHVATVVCAEGNAGALKGEVSTVGCNRPGIEIEVLARREGSGEIEICKGRGREQEEERRDTIE